MSKKFNFIYFYCFAVVMIFCNGCELLLIGTIAAGSTYSATTGVVKDTLNAPKEELIEKFIILVENEKGDILSASISDGKVKAKINQKITYFHVEKVNDNTSKVLIRSRKEFEVVPDSKEAIRLYKKLVEQL